MKISPTKRERKKETHTIWSGIFGQENIPNQKKKKNHIHYNFNVNSAALIASEFS